MVYPFVKTSYAKQMERQFTKEELGDDRKRSQLIACYECSKSCATHLFLTNKEAADILANKEKVKQILNCELSGMPPKPPPRYGVFSR